MRDVAVAYVPVTAGAPTNVQNGQVTKLDWMSSANSWNTLADTNGCSTTLPVLKDVPTRTVARPIRLSMSRKANVPDSSAPGVGSGRPTALNGSTLVRDQMKPADGSM